MVSSPSLQCCSPRRPLLMLSLACRLDTHAAVAVRRRTSLLDVGDLGALGPARCAVRALPFRLRFGKKAADRGRKIDGNTPRRANLPALYMSVPHGNSCRYTFANSARSVATNLLLFASGRARCAVTNLTRWTRSPVVQIGAWHASSLSASHWRAHGAAGGPSPASMRADGLPIRRSGPHRSSHQWPPQAKTMATTRRSCAMTCSRLTQRSARRPCRCAQAEAASPGRRQAARRPR